jgi:uncharacterized protein (TIGR02246 family)
MKWYCLVLGACLMPTAAVAQAPSDAGGPAAAMRAMADCWAKRDADCLAAHVTDDLVYTNAVGRHWRSKTAAHQGWLDMLASPMAAAPEVDDQLVRLVDPDTAIVWESGWIKGVKTPEGRALPPMRTFMTALLVRRGGTWLMAAGHTSVVPPPAN